MLSSDLQISEASAVRQLYLSSELFSLNFDTRKFHKIIVSLVYFTWLVSNLIILDLDNGEEIIGCTWPLKTLSITEIYTNSSNTLAIMRTSETAHSVPK